MIQLISRVFLLDIPTKAKFLMVCLADSADEFGVCYPSMAHLSRDTSMPERTLQRAMGWLLDHGHVTAFWSYADKIRTKKVRHFRLNLQGIKEAPVPDLSNCTRELREQVILRFEQTCSYCGGLGDQVNGPDGTPWNVDRIIPGSKGGHYVADNVTLSCRNCNSDKGAKPASQLILSLGAKLAESGCQTGGTVVPPAAHYPSLEPSLTEIHREALKRVWEYYLQRLNKNPLILSFTSERKKKGQLRLAECLEKTKGDLGKAVELMRLAIDALAVSGFHLGENSSGKRFDSWEENLFRSAEQFERWLERA